MWVRSSSGGRGRSSYAPEHSQRGFFRELVDYMTSGPVLLICLEGENAITANRTLMGATDPAQADAGNWRISSGARLNSWGNTCGLRNG